MGNTIVGGGGGGGVVDDLPVSVSVPLHLLPEEVLIEILARLPVISLLRFKSVSKSWRDLIQTSFFIHLHTTTTFNSSSSSSSCSKFGDGGGGGVVDDLPVSVSVPVPPLLLLPEEVLIEILARLPVISLLRFKSVSKSWRDLIQTSFFIHLHTTTTFNSSSSSSCSKFGDDNAFILQMSPNTFGADGWASERKMYMLSFRSGRSSDGGGDDIEDDDQVVFKMDNLRFLPYYKRFPSTHMINMVGSCHGLICLHHSELRDVYLWNPATRQFRILPKSITIQEKHEEEKIQGIGKFCSDFLAFGFDVKTKDYKVVQISCFVPTYIAQRPPGCMTCRVQVYSLSTDSWRLLEGINSLPACPLEDSLFNHGVYLNGSYFFVGRKFPSIEELDEQGETSLMLSFDFTKEIFTTMQFPLDHDHRHHFLLTHLGDKIALLTIRIKPSFFFFGDDDQPRDCDDDYENYDIWVLDEQGGAVNKESWAKLHSLRIKERVARERIKPRGILNNGEFALIETRTRFLPDDDELTYELNELHLLNLVTKETTMSFPIRESMLRADIYKQSLVSIIGGNGAAATNKVVGGAMCPPL